MLVDFLDEQGRYWDMHDRLFQNQNQLGVAELPKHAQAIGMDIPLFQHCLTSGKRAGKIRKDMDEGQRAEYRERQTFFLGVQDSDGQTIKVIRMSVGAQPYAQFKQAIEGAFSEINK